MSIHTRNEIIEEIEEYAHPVLQSEEYRQCCGFTHHHRTTIADHMVHVTFMSLAMCRLLSRMNIDIDRRHIVLISMTHDLAMVHRHEYGRFQTAFRHPVDSASIAEQIVPMSDKEKKNVKRHMWPLCVVPPTTREGWILTLSDKICAFQELFGRNRAWAELV